ncbi:hypothetical protein FOZ62_019043 [Perkinsus olseni]|uniref:Uncharacterized protein n=1 Tax=Perkinsus olseni TaxID=32597 RepID=A0A7J6SKD6_PEROL|nr:hypothetical protein FOZ62_019043 [Perkinsus olseni]
MPSLRSALRTSMVTALLGTHQVSAAATRFKDIETIVTSIRETKRSRENSRGPSHSEVLASIREASKISSQKAHLTY